MALPVRIDPLAEADLEETRLWYEEQRTGLGNEFVDAVDQAVERIQRLPHGYPIQMQDVRIIVLSRFPFNLCYRVLTDSITVVAVYHAKRDPRHWLERL